MDTKTPLQNCQGCHKLQLQIDMKETECNEHIKLIKSLESTAAKLHDQVQIMKHPIKILHHLGSAIVTRWSIIA